MLLISYPLINPGKKKIKYMLISEC